MAVPPSVRYLFARLQPVTQPIVWGPVLVTVLLGVFLWEYRVHPEWSDSFEIDLQSRSAQIPETDLTLEEQAELAQVDNLNTLFNDLAASTPSTQFAETPGDNLLGQLSEAASSNPSRLNSSYSPGTLASLQASSPFSTTSATSLFSLIPEILPQGAQGAQATEASQPSALQSALGRLPGQSSSSAPQSPANDARQANGETAQPFGTVPAGNLEDTRSGTALPRFIPTTPGMSPLPGTTGYTLPPTLNLAPSSYPQGNAYTNLATPSGLPQNRPDFSGLPNRSAAPVLPPSSGSQYSQPQVPQTSVPFAVPRPPGSYIGGGQIQTFSNPLGSSTWEPEDYPNNYNY
ncbi:MAG: hypothetical protein HC816_01085 [Leptolyngbyaceae cyanobacterium RM1_1_2]|nr:hypothetical protein [Leptolyngbyaceae cyanobacterium RM1_1_2]